MKTIFKICMLFLVFIIVKNLNAQTEINKTKIMVLGTHHLTHISNYKPEMLDELVAKLDIIKFDVICIENMAGELLYDIRSRKDSAFVDLLNDFGGDRISLADSAQKYLGIGFLEAQNNATELFKKDTLSDIDHKLLMEYFTASGNLASATLHYEYVKNKSILGESSFEGQMLEKIKEVSGSANEIYSLALRLAHKQNLQKLECIDNFQDEALLLKYYPGFMQDYISNQELFKNLGNCPVYTRINELVKHGIETNNLLDLYIFMNSKEYQDQDFNAQWSIWLNTNFLSGSDRARYFLWEMRNLQIAANILKTAAVHPNKKLLIIIGASHKSFIEKHLQQIPDIELLEFK